MPIYQIGEKECTGCGTCLESCPAGAITMQGQVARIDPELCTLCGSCSDVCPQNAIYEYEEVPALYARSRAVTPSRIRKSPLAVIRETPPLTRQEKIAAAAAIVPVLSKFFLRLVGHISLRDREGGHPASSGDLGRQPAVKAGQGRHRWRGGS